MKLMKTDESQTDDSNPENESITTSDEHSSEIVLQAQHSVSDEQEELGNKCVRNVILLGTDQNVTLTHINLKVSTCHR